MFKKWVWVRVSVRVCVATVNKHKLVLCAFGIKILIQCEILLRLVVMAKRDDQSIVMMFD